MNRFFALLLLCFPVVPFSCQEKKESDMVTPQPVAAKSVEPFVVKNDSAFYNLPLTSADSFKITKPLKPLGWTSDYEKIFTPLQVAELDKIINDFEKETGNEIAILTLDSAGVPMNNFDDFTQKIANYWGVGKKGLNNGMLIGISTQLRKIRINTGSAIRLKLTDADSKKIIEEIILPQFNAGNYFEGTKKGLLAMVQRIR